MIRSTLARSLKAACVAQPRLSASRIAPSRALPCIAPTSTVRFLQASAVARGSGSTDSELSSRLAQEITYERESAAAGSEGEGSESASEEPEFVKDFKAAGVWRIQDVAGSDEIALTREYGNEHIRVLFSIGDIDTSENDFEEEEGSEEEQEAGFPVRCAITISKEGKGALTLDAQAEDGQFTVENISYYKDAKLATDLSADADWARRGLYIGPQFETLDENVQAQFEAFLNERGIDSDLARFVPDFAELKEQKEYCSWLENVKAFVDA
ncbi:mitochondrial glyco protein [Ceraceosorus guamensis]|uniref:Mitochondrial glyco protein n=1 Tax=Ceraceosorus guamensis TaxID=1522189 RepID=A0A316W930_9BASI|nr:mitochondrial glyco protein [Ceraceosorus guamensis]PWN46084.1 mitochondrial glyco protein [Ceraceosorus guamensis]